MAVIWLVHPNVFSMRLMVNLFVQLFPHSVKNLLVQLPEQLSCMLMLILFVQLLPHSVTNLLVQLPEQPSGVLRALLVQLVIEPAVAIREPAIRTAANIINDFIFFLG
jgi:hypothetical protein